MTTALKAIVGCADVLPHPLDVRGSDFSLCLLCASLMGACGGADPASSEGSSEASSADASSTTASEAGTADTSTSTSTSESATGESDAESEASATTVDAESGESESTDTSGETSASTETSETGTDGCEGGPVKSALFLGNSYTAFNNLPALIADIACSAGYVLEFQSVTPGGFTFGGHLTNAGSTDAIAAQPWDVVVLQNQSQVPGFWPSQVEAQSLPNAIGLADLINANDPGTEIVYFQTWGRVAGDTQNCASHPLVCTFEGHTQALAEGYAMYHEATGDSIAPVGFAWLDAVESAAPAFDTAGLWSGDGSHPSLHGSYLSAAVFFAHLYDESPEGLEFPAELPAEEAQWLQSIAADTVLGG